ncbi:MAG: hypothetical protein FWD80_06385 [Propionibacteriaceae bacterium]|nr:hypothetical protein [Propionibacteriaceae bacterium]
MATPLLRDKRSAARRRYTSNMPPAHIIVNAITPAAAAGDVTAPSESILGPFAAVRRQA